MATFFSSAQVDSLYKDKATALAASTSLQIRYLRQDYTRRRGAEHASAGFCRRLGTLSRSIELVFELLPPELDAIPSHDAVMDATIAIQAFVLNVFGCLDNLAWILVHEKGVRNADGSEIKPKSVSLRNKHLLATVSADFVALLDSHADWFNELKRFRDALAHRIPLYVPPFIVRPDAKDEYARLEREYLVALEAGDMETYSRLVAEQHTLGQFQPWMTHSRTEEAPSIVFHPQLLSDFNTVEEIGRNVLDELTG